MMYEHLNQQDIDRYLDGELSTDRTKRLLVHLENCDACRRLLDDRRALILAIRSARPQIAASAKLRDSILAVLDGANETPGQADASDKVTPIRTPTKKKTSWSALKFLSYAALLCVLLGVSIWRIESRRMARADSFVQMAVETHQRSTQGLMPIQLQTKSARKVTAWLSPQLPFKFRLPTYQEDSGDWSRYQLMGGSVTSYRGKRAAYIAYRMQNELISLVVVSADQAVALGGDIAIAKNLVFHSMQRGELDVVTWSVHNLTYALVSNMKLPRRQSCVVCHANPRDQVWKQSTAVQYAYRVQAHLLPNQVPSLAPFSAH